MKPTGTPNDNALFVNIEGFYRVGGHAGKVGRPCRRASPRRSPTQAEKKSEAAKSAAEGRQAEEHHDEHEHEAIPESQKQVSAVLVCIIAKESQTAALAAEINKGKEAQAAIPSEETAGSSRSSSATSKSCCWCSP